MEHFITPPFETTADAAFELRGVSMPGILLDGDTLLVDVKSEIRDFDRAIVKRAGVLVPVVVRECADVYGGSVEAPIICYPMHGGPFRLDECDVPEFLGRVVGVVMGGKNADQS